MNVHATPWSAAILAGGEARRFGGRDKCGLLVDGQAILDRQLAELLPATDDIMLVGGPARPVPPGVRQVADRQPGLGPLAGLDAALAHAHHDTVVAVACDMPFISVGVIAHLVSLAQTADVVVPFGDRGYHPLCAVYSRACHGAVERRLAERRLKMTELFDELQVRVVPTDELGAFGDVQRLMANLNRPEDLADLLAAPPRHKP